MPLRKFPELHIRTSVETFGGGGGCKVEITGIYLVSKLFYFHRSLFTCGKSRTASMAIETLNVLDIC